MNDYPKRKSLTSVTELTEDDQFRSRGERNTIEKCGASGTNKLFICRLMRMTQVRT